MLFVGSKDEVCFAALSGMTGTVETDINSGYKYPHPPGTLNYRETGGSNQAEVQIRVDKPSQHNT